MKKIILLTSVLLFSGISYGQNCQQQELKIQSLKAELALLKSVNKTEKTPKYVCSAGCSNGVNDVLLLHSETGFGATRSEAQSNAKKTLLDAKRCTYGAVDTGCEVIGSNIPSYSCQASCTDTSGKADPSSSIKLKGRTKVEAKVSALKELAVKYNCNYGETVVCK